MKPTMSPLNTKEQNIQKIRKACTKANPEIMELKNGCLIKIWWLDNPSEREPDEIVPFSDRTMRNNGESDNKYSQIIEDSMTGTVEILGRPIRLADVLLAIEKNANWFPDLWLKSVFPLTAPFYENSWNLKDDNLTHQSEETLSFIASLL